MVFFTKIQDLIGHQYSKILAAAKTELGRKIDSR
jgi:hypothetical protein